MVGGPSIVFTREAVVDEPLYVIHEKFVNLFLV